MERAVNFCPTELTRGGVYSIYGVDLVRSKYPLEMTLGGSGEGGWPIWADMCGEDSCAAPTGMHVWENSHRVHIYPIIRTKQRKPRSDMGGHISDISVASPIPCNLNERLEKRMIQCQHQMCPYLRYILRDLRRDTKIGFTSDVSVDL